MPKKPAPDLIRGGYRFSEKIMLQQQARARCEEKSSRSGLGTSGRDIDVLTMRSRFHGIVSAPAGHDWAGASAHRRSRHLDDSGSDGDAFLAQQRAASDSAASICGSSPAA